LGLSIRTAARLVCGLVAGAIPRLRLGRRTIVPCLLLGRRRAIIPLLARPARVARIARRRRRRGGPRLDTVQLLALNVLWKVLPIRRLQRLLGRGIIYPHSLSEEDTHMARPEELLVPNVDELCDHAALAGLCAFFHLTSEEEPDGCRYL